MRVADADLLDEFLGDQPEYSADLKALVLRMVHQQGGAVAVVSQQTGVPLATIYHWLQQWNQGARLEKKRA